MSSSSPPKGFEVISREDSFPGCRHCVHTMIHCPVADVKLFNNPKLVIKNTILMMMRHDGRLGFPGGFVDADDENLEAGALRELVEELGNVPENFKILPSDYMYSHRTGKLCLHLFIKEVTFEEFLQIETRNGQQDYSGFEVLGPVRVPLFVMGDKRSGFPAFLRNNFIGNARQQLIDGIRKKQLLDDDILEQYISLSKERDDVSS